MKHLNLSIPKTSAINWRFSPEQLKSNNVRGFTLLKAGLACVLLFFSNAENSGQTASAKSQIDVVDRHETYSLAGARVATSHIVRGIVKDEAGNPMPGVNIYLKGSTEGTVTDTEGRFEFPRMLEAGERLTISFIGYESVEYVVQNIADENIAIVMSVNVIVIGEVGIEKVYSSKPGLRQWLSGFKNIF